MMTLVRRITMSIDTSAASNLTLPEQFEMDWNRDEGTAWCYWRPQPRPCFNADVLAGICALPERLPADEIHAAAAAGQPSFLVLGHVRLARTTSAAISPCSNA